MLIDVEKIIVKDRIRKDFGNLDELAKDIQENGLINPPVVTPDYVLIAGERRFRAMTQILGWKQIEVRPMTVQDALHQLKLEISENENRKDFSFSEKMDWAERLKEEYRKIAEANRLANLTNSSTVGNPTLGRVDETVAREVGLGGKDKLRQGEYIKAHGDEELIRQLDENELSINAAYVRLKKQAEEAQSKLEEKERENEELRQETVEAVKMARGAVKASDDSAEYLRMKQELEQAKEEERKYYEKWNEEKKKERGIPQDEVREKIESAVEKAKMEYRKLVDSLQTQLDAAQDTEPEVVEVEVVPDDYEEIKAELKRLKQESREAYQTDFSKQLKRKAVENENPEDILIGYERRLMNETGSFLSIARGWEVQFDLCPKLSSVSKALVRKNIEQFQQILTKLDAAIMGGEEECKSA